MKRGTPYIKLVCATLNKLFLFYYHISLTEVSLTANKLICSKYIVDTFWHIQSHEIFRQAGFLSLPLSVYSVSIDLVVVCGEGSNIIFKHT